MQSSHIYTTVASTPSRVLALVRLLHSCGQPMDIDEIARWMRPPQSGPTSDEDPRAVRDIVNTCVELRIAGGAVLCRSAGTSATLMAREADWAQVSLPSGEVRRIPSVCRATIGQVGNSDHMNVRLGKAGRARWMGRRPHVRGTAMNPIDHPHGGGEGRTKGGRHPVSPQGKSAKGGATRQRRKPSNSAIVRRRKSRRYGQLKLPK